MSANNSKTKKRLRCDESEISDSDEEYREDAESEAYGSSDDDSVLIKKKKVATASKTKILVSVDGAECEAEESSDNDDAVSTKKKKTTNTGHKKTKAPLVVVPTPPYEYEKYCCSENASGTEIWEKLSRFGVAIVPNVLNEEECKHVTGCAWDYFEKITEKCEKPIDRNNQSTWCLFKNLFGQLGGQLYQNFGTGVMEGSRFCRVKGASVFARLYNVRPEDLLVSVDAFSLGIPPKLLPKKEIAPKRPTVLHSDQSYAKRGLVTVQSWLTSENVEEGDRSLEFLEGSHLLHEEFAKAFFTSRRKSPPKEDWFHLKDPEHIAFYEANDKCLRRRIRCPKGSMVLWDSRTIHSGANPVKGYEHNLRCVSYVCCLPRSGASPKELARKKKFAESLLVKARTASHNPISFRPFPHTPRTYGAPLPPLVDFPPPTLDSFSPLEKRLYGFI
jgi:hypothetical protein